MINHNLLEYSENYTHPETVLLQKLNRETHLKVLRPRMISGHLQGRLLQLISQMINPRYILEIGTFTGYSSICLSAGLKKNGLIFTIEINPELEDMIIYYFRKTRILNKSRLLIGNALNIIPDLNNTFDLVYIDADKENYVNYYNLIFPKLRKGGFIIADNALWDGKVLQNPIPNDKETLGIIKFNNLIRNDKRIENLLLPFRDGLQIIRKL